MFQKLITLYVNDPFTKILTGDTRKIFVSKIECRVI